MTTCVNRSPVNKGELFILCYMYHVCYIPGLIFKHLMLKFTDELDVQAS